MPLVYEELRKLAAAKLAQEKPGQTLQATALVHEAYMRLVDADETQDWNSRGHFFGAAAEAMRRILVENARSKLAIKRGAGAGREDLPCSQIAAVGDPEELRAIHDVLDNLSETDEAAGELVKLRYFAGLNMIEAAQALGISPRKAHYTWAYASIDGGPHWVSNFRSFHQGGAFFLMADGSVHFVNDTIDMKTYRGLSTIQGGEPVTLD